MVEELQRAVGPEHWKHKLGKLPARPGAYMLQLASYIDLSLPKPPVNFVHADPPPFFDFKNSEVGNCVFAGGANEQRLWMHEGGIEVEFTTDGVMEAYRRVTGYDGTTATDKGTDMQAAAEFRRKVGILDSQGRRQCIDAYASLRLGSVDYLRAAIWLFGGVGVGFKFPTYAMDQFDNGEKWDVKWSWSRVFGKEKIAGGHYVPAIGFKDGYILCVTWGKIQPMSPNFYLRYTDEAVVYLDLDRLHRVKRLSPEGFDERELRRDLTRIARGPVVARKDDLTDYA